MVAFAEWVPKDWPAEEMPKLFMISAGCSEASDALMLAEPRGFLGAHKGTCGGVSEN